MCTNKCAHPALTLTRTHTKVKLRLPEKCASPSPSTLRLKPKNTSSGSLMSTLTDALPSTRTESIADLKRRAIRLRIEIIKMIGAAGSGHPGGSLSEVELLLGLYFRVLRHNPKDPNWADRDRFILSKGHGCPALYAVLPDPGYIHHSILATLRKLGSPRHGHPDKRFLPVLEASTGSLGQGISVGIGMALAPRLHKKELHTFLIVDDAAIEERKQRAAA